MSKVVLGFARVTIRASGLASFGNMKILGGLLDSGFKGTFGAVDAVAATASAAVFADPFPRVLILLAGIIQCRCRVQDVV